MPKYHIRKDGTPGVCNAQKGNCPFGESAPHFESIEAAQQFADLKNRIEVEDDFSLSWNKVYSLNEKEADSLVNSIDKTVGEIDNEIQAVESKMKELTRNEEWFDYKDSEEDFEEAKRERIRISNSDDDHAESMKLMKEDLGRITRIHEFRDGDYLIEISSKDYWSEKPKYTGYKINEDGTKEQTVLPKIPQEVVQKAFKSKENKDAFAETKKAKNAFIMRFAISICSSKVLSTYCFVEGLKKRSVALLTAPMPMICPPLIFLSLQNCVRAFTISS